MALISGFPGISYAEKGFIPHRRCSYCGRTGDTGEKGQQESTNGVSIEPDVMNDSDAIVTLLQCSGCHVALYCSKDHQRLDWKTKHKPVCKMIQQKRLEESQRVRINETRSERPLTANVFSEFPLQGSSFGYSVSKNSPTAHGLPETTYRNLTTAHCNTVGTINANDKAVSCEVNQQNTLDNSSQLELQTSSLHVSNDDDHSSTKIDHSTNKRFNLASDPWFKSISFNQSRFSLTSDALLMGAGARPVKPSFQELWPVRIQRIAYCVSVSLKRYGWVVLDNFLGPVHCDMVLKDVCQAYNTPGYFTDGQLVKTQSGSQASDIRSDKIHWFDNRTEKDSVHISLLVSIIDSVIARLFDLPYSINGRSKAMVACYPGDASKYVRHVDNPDHDGRCITSIYYLNHNWTKKCGGVLRMYPQTAIEPVDIEPIADRIIFFWSDKRNPHEVLPSFTMRYAITIWYFDKSEREAAKSRSGSADFSYVNQQHDESHNHSHHDHPGQHSMDFVPPTSNQMNDSYQLASLSGVSPPPRRPSTNLSKPISCTGRVDFIASPAEGTSTLASSPSCSDRCEETRSISAVPKSPACEIAQTGNTGQHLSNSWPTECKTPAEKWHLCQSLLNIDQFQKTPPQLSHIQRSS